MKKQRTKFEELRVYRLSEEVADLVWSMVNKWPLLAQRTVGEQLVRAADSIGANIAEGVGRGSFQDNRRHVRIARGSLHETKHFLRRAFKRGLMTQAQTEALQPLVEELAPKLNAYLRSITRLCGNPSGKARVTDMALTTDNGQQTTNHA